MIPKTIGKTAADIFAKSGLEHLKKPETINIALVVSLVFPTFSRGFSRKPAESTYKRLGAIFLTAEMILVVARMICRHHDQGG